MGLIAVVGLALVMTKSYLRCYSVLYSLVSTEPANVRVMGPREWLYAGVPFLVLISAALWPLRISRAGRPFRRIARLPGLGVSYAAWVALVFSAVRTVFDWRAEFRNTHFPVVGMLTLGEVYALRVVAMKDFIGPAVGVTWLVLWLGGGWQAKSGWIDLIGRVLGLSWIALGVGLWVDYIVRR
jgi:hypothetical protein